MLRFCRRLLKLLLASAFSAGALYVTSDSFGRSWRLFVIDQMAERGLFLDFRGLSLDPVGGLVAREVRIFASPDQGKVLAAVDRLHLDFDLGKLFESRVMVEGLELRNATLALPTDPGATDQRIIVIREMNARAFLLDGRLELHQAEGTLSGIRLSISGDLTLPRADTAQGGRKDGKEMAMRGLQTLKDHRELIGKALDWLRRFEFTSTPQLTLTLRGSLERPEEMNAKVFFEAHEFRYGGYVCRELTAEAEYSSGLIDLTRFQLRDRTGQVVVSAAWRLGSEDVRFDLTSSADLPALAEAFLNSDNLREIVFYEPPHLALRGVWHLGGRFANHKRPVRVIGRLECGRFSSRGEVFDGLSANIGVAPEGVYVRDISLRHQTGTLAAQALVHETEGARYRVDLRMDPRVFAPFALQEQTRELLRRFDFARDSHILLNLEGHGPSLSLQECINTGTAELRHFRYRGVPIDEANGDLEFHGKVHHYRDIHLRRPEGTGTAAEVQLDYDKYTVRLSGVRTGVDPVAVLSCFAPELATAVAKYQLPPTTGVAAEGTVNWRDAGQNDIHVKFRHLDGAARFELGGQEYQIGSPGGSLHFDGRDLNFDISGRLYDNAVFARGRADLKPGSGAFSAQVRAGALPYKLFKKPVTFEGVSAAVSRSGGKGGPARFDINATVLGGSVSLTGSLAERACTGELKVEEISVARFAQLFSQGTEARGDLTGHFGFSVRGTDWQTLRGDGVAIIVNGSLYSVPILGPLTPLLATILPGQTKDFNLAKEANCNFSVADGAIRTTDFEVLTDTLRLLMRGKIDFISDQLDLTAQVRVRGLPGLVLIPLTELFEFRGEGSISRPEWRPSLLPSALPRSPSDSAPAAGSAGGASAPPPKRQAPSFNRLGGR